MTKSLSKIIKANFVSFTEHNFQIPTIDKNNPKIIQSSLNVDNSENQEELNAEKENNGFEIDEFEIDEFDLEEIASGAGFETMTKAEQESLLAEIDEVKSESSKEGYDEGFSQGIEDGKQQGYDKGFQQGVAEGQDSLQKSIKSNEMKQESIKQELIQEYENYKKDLEPKMLEIIEALVVKLIGIQEISKGTIMHLIHAGLNELELHGDLVIKVSSFDLDYVIERKNELTEDLSEKIKVEILRDQQLQQNECVIETEMGTIECSLGTQLEGLIKELRLIRESLVKE